jgi:hypothetical protein
MRITRWISAFVHAQSRYIRLSFIKSVLIFVCLKIETAQYCLVAAAFIADGTNNDVVSFRLSYANIRRILNRTINASASIWGSSASISRLAISRLLCAFRRGFFSYVEMGPC